MRIDVSVPEGASGPWRVEAFNVSEQESEMTLARAKITGAINEFVPTGNYKRLVREDTVVMSNTPMEIRTNRTFIHRAKGKVLINGLGLGMVLSAILKKPEIESVTVVEASEDVIKLVGPSFCDDPRLRIVHACAFEYQPEPGALFDAVWHDIWDEICDENLPEMHKLHRKYGQRTKWQGSWARAECEVLRDRAKIFTCEIKE
ncbi:MULTISPECIES: hypothetical protein [Aeromonas]|uniref:Spermidine synthase n=1 Tax=Aeromonas salmonicida TaxID=645 RepID=A0AAX1PDN3_AERSA|nr:MULTISPECIES: hypothetical protein [Aeromonas]MDU4190089.1 hypothetical protein [Aeromonas sp.]RAI99296.1 hypothetical protein DEU50_1253 [Aeromonas salmonicida]